MVDNGDLVTVIVQLDIEQAHFTYTWTMAFPLPLVNMVLHLVSSVKIQLVFTLLAVHTMTPIYVTPCINLGNVGNVDKQCNTDLTLVTTGDNLELPLL